MATYTGGESSMVTASNGVGWPLHKISEPHEYHDVLLNNPESITATNQESSQPQEDEPPFPWRSIQLNNRGDASLLRGNLRFYELLQSHQEDYERRPKMEKPLVTVQILQEWRSQSPPGRFLVVEPETTLWKDIGDKKARSKISKALKYLTKTHGDANAITGSQPKPQQSTPTTTNSPSASSPAFAAQETAPSAIHAPKGMPSEIPVSEAIGVSNARSPSDLSTESVSIGDPTPATPHLLTQTEESKVSQDSPHLVSAMINGSATQPAFSTQIIHQTLPISKYEEEEKKAGNPSDPYYTFSSVKLPRIPARFPNITPARFRKPERYVRRISEQLHSAQEEGSIYGRWSERDQLATIYERQKLQRPIVDLVLISGKIGVGKTALAETLKIPLIENDCGYDIGEEETEWPFFLHGKFEHCSWSDPNAFFVSIVTDFCHQLGKRNDLMLTRKYRNALVETLKEDVFLLSNLVPALDALLKSPHRSSSQCNSMDNSNTSPAQERPQDDSFACMAMQRMKEVFGKFLQIIANVDPEKHTLIVLLDDLHWASESSFGILTSLVTDRKNGGVLFVLTYRDDEADEPYFENGLLQWDHNQSVNIMKFHLENLKEASVHLMLADALSLQEEETRSLNSLVCSLTKGNPTFITELLRVFQDKGVLQFEEASQQWTCDLQRVPAMLGNIDCVPGLFKAKILELPQVIQETLKIAACLWSTEIDENVLKMIDTVGAVSSHLKLADMRGLLTHRNGEYAFVSDGVKQAIYDLIPVAERAAYHLKIGQRLWLHLDENETSSFYSLLMSQMFMGDSMIIEDEDRRAVAALCLRAGRLAAKYLGFQTAKWCLSHGISIVRAQKTWGRDNYDLSLSLHNTAIEVCYCNGEFKELQSLIEEVLENARTFEDSLLARSTQIYTLGSRNKQMEAIEVGLETLKQLGVEFPCMHPSGLRVKWEARRLRSLLHGLSDEVILKLPRMKEPKKLAAMQIMNHFILYTVYATPNLSALVAFKMVELTITDGLSAISSVGFALYGTMLCRFDAIDEGFRYGQLAMKISAAFKKAVWFCRASTGYYGTVHCRKRSVQEALEPLRNAYRAGMRTGDVEFSMLSACLVCWNNCELVPLPELEAELIELGGQTEFYGQTLHFIMLKPLWQAALNLMGKVPGDPKFLKGELIDDDVEAAMKGDNPHFLMWIRFFQMKVAYLFGDYKLAGQHTDGAVFIYTNSSGAMDCVYSMLYECMTLLALARQGKRRLRRILYVKRRLKRMKFWTMHAPTNFLGKQLLLEAELAMVCGNRQKANSHYRSSILHSRENGMFLEEALANEKLGRLYLESKEDDLAVPFLEEARRVYEKWGAKAKVGYFDGEFGELLDSEMAESNCK